MVFVLRIDMNISNVYTLDMSDTTILNVKIDKKLKKQAQEVAKALGLPVSTIVTASLKDVISRRSITISDEPRIRPEVEAELLKISAEAKKGINLSPSFDSLKDARKWLDSNRDES